METALGLVARRQFPKARRIQERERRETHALQSGLSDAPLQSTEAQVGAGRKREGGAMGGENWEETQS